MIVLLKIRNRTQPHRGGHRNLVPDSGDDRHRSLENSSHCAKTPVAKPKNPS
jgi:hypothetical protein